MTRILRWVRNGVLGLLVFAILVVAVGYVLSARILNRQYDATGSPIVASGLPQDIAEGERLAAIAGCTGCHGAELEGGIFIEDRVLGSIIAPDLTRIASTHTDAELERVIRRGVRKDGSSVWVMPSDMFVYMTDEHLGKILSYIRSRPIGSGPETKIEFRGARAFILAGVFTPAAERVEGRPWPREPSPSDPVDWGHYLAKTACTECHGPDLEGAEDGSAPHLAIAASYTAEQFKTLMRTGVPAGGHELDLMAEVAQGRFVHFTEQEVEALHSYLRGMAGA